MGRITGQKEFEKFKNGETLTMKQVILANCYMCNGFEESAGDCGGFKYCALYRFSPHGRRKKLHFQGSNSKKTGNPSFKGSSLIVEVEGGASLNNRTKEIEVLKD